MSRLCFVLLLVIFLVSGIDGRSTETFELHVKSIKECGSPNPPFPKERISFTAYSIQNQKEKALISGRHSFLAEVPFQNFSMTGFSVDKFGKEDLLMFIENISCQNWIGKAYLTFGKIRYYKKDCRVRKGVYEFRNIDMKPIVHRFPNLYAIGTMLYRMHLVHNNSTVFCNDLLISIQ